MEGRGVRGLILTINISHFSPLFCCRDGSVGCSVGCLSISLTISHLSPLLSPSLTFLPVSFVVLLVLFA